MPLSTSASNSHYAKCDRRQHYRIEVANYRVPCNGCSYNAAVAVGLLAEVVVAFDVHLIISVQLLHPLNRRKSLRMNWFILVKNVVSH